MAQTALVVVGVFTLLIWFFGYVPFLCFHLLRFRNFRLDVTLSKRYPQITVITVTALIAWLLSFLFEIVYHFFGGWPLLESIYDWISIPVYFVFACSIVWRFWLSYYDIQFSISTSSREWQKFINTDAQFDNWYFRHRKRYGDYRWTKLRVMMATTLFIILFILISILPWLAPLRFVLAILPWLAILALYCKTPSFYDEFAIRREMKRIALLYSSVLLLYLLLSVIIFIVNRSVDAELERTTTLQVVLMAVTLNFLALVLFLIGHSMTYWVLQTVDVGFDEDGNPLRAPLNPWSPKHHVAKASASGLSGVGAVESESVDTLNSSQLKAAGNGNTAEHEAKVTLSTMFNELKYLNEFFAHLSREFSMECLLSLIEFIQFQQYILLHMQQYKNFYYKQFSNVSGMRNTVALPKGVPRSTIIDADREQLVEQYLHNESGRIVSVMEREQVRVRLIAYELYKKYVAIGSEWEINIAYETRGQLTARLHNFAQWMSAKQKSVQMWQLALLFEDSKHEMYKLLRHSFARFKRHEDFDKITSYHQKKMREKQQAMAVALAETQRQKQKEQKPLSPKQASAYQELPDQEALSDGPIVVAPQVQQEEEEEDTRPAMVDSIDIIAELRTADPDDY